MTLHRALLSVYDKTGLADFAAALSRLGIGLLSTGATASALRTAGLEVTDVESVTQFPEIMDGRVKTLHPQIHGGLLGVAGLHDAEMITHAIAPIDLLVVTLYPFEETVAADAGFDEIISKIDIGGPAMIRSAAKNHARVTVIVDEADYGVVLAELAANNGHTTPQLRRRLAAKAFMRTAAYDSAIARWFASLDAPSPGLHASFGGTRSLDLRYGENPHQAASLYRTGESRAGVVTARQMQGKALSYNNINDTDAAFECVAEFTDGPACVIVKHANPCGVARGHSLAEAFARARACDPDSAFGGIIALNGTLDEETAEAIAQNFTEVIIAPDATEAALARLAAKPALRLLLTGSMPDPHTRGLQVKSVAGGLLVQERDARVMDAESFKIVTARAPTSLELSDLRFAFIVAKHVKSNAIVFARDGVTTGIGAGQMSRIDSARIAALKGGANIQGSVIASDAFFPFADGLLACAEAGATAVIQPGGSVKDAEIIKAADAAGLAMVFTGLRHFRH